jgi:hypothetical protein
MIGRTLYQVGAAHLVASQKCCRWLAGCGCVLRVAVGVCSFVATGLCQTISQRFMFVAVIR